MKNVIIPATMHDAVRTTKDEQTKPDVQNVRLHKRGCRCCRFVFKQLFDAYEE